MHWYKALLNEPDEINGRSTGVSPFTYPGCLRTTYADGLAVAERPVRSYIT
jgi:hypothetical protein